MNRTPRLFQTAITAAWLLTGMLLAGEKDGELKDDEKNLAVLAGAYHGASLNWMQSRDVRLAEPTK